MGALPGSCILSERPAALSFDVERYRASTDRVVVVHEATHPAVVLGSTQLERSFDRSRAEAAGVEVVRRRSGGGAVYVGPGDPLWFDLWLPRGDPLWDDDVVAAARWVGEWWAGALQAAGAAEVVVHTGSSEPTSWSRLFCFAGLGPGEVTARGRKVVGVAQWRCRQGALFHTCAYRQFDPRPLVDLLTPALLGTVGPGGLADHLRQVAAGTSEVAAAGLGPDALVARLPSGPPWQNSL